MWSFVELHFSCEYSLWLDESSCLFFELFNSGWYWYYHRFLCQNILCLRCWIYLALCIFIVFFSIAFINYVGDFLLVSNLISLFEGIRFLRWDIRNKLKISAHFNLLKTVRMDRDYFSACFYCCFRFHVKSNLFGI